MTKCLGEKREALSLSLSLSLSSMVMCACPLNSSYPASLSLSLPLHHVMLPKSSFQLSPHYSSLKNIPQAVACDEPLPRAAVAAADSAVEATEPAKYHEMKLLLLQGEKEQCLQSSQNINSKAKRRERRRRRRAKEYTKIDDDDDKDCCKKDEKEDCSLFMEKRCSLRSERSRYLTRRQEAEFSHYLKEAAMLDNKGKHGLEYCSEAATGARSRRCRSDEALLRARECKDRITLSYRRLVISIAKAYQGKGLTLQDLVQEGCIGLLKGAQRYDQNKGYKMSTYVYWWIKQGIVRAIANKSRLVRLPGNLCEDISKISEANSLLKQRLQRWPTHEEIAEYMTMNASTVRTLMERNRPLISIDQPMSKDGLTLKEIVQGPDDLTPEAMVSRQLLQQTIQQVLMTLNEREEKIIRLYYGLNGRTSQSFEEIGRSMNLSRERIRQIHSSAVIKLQKNKSFQECLQIVV